MKTYYDAPSATVAQSYLSSHGLVAILLDWHTVTNAWHYSLAVHGIRLCTVEPSLPQAQALLEKGVEPSDPEFVRTADPINWLIATFALFFVGLPFPVRRPRYRKCSDPVDEGGA